MAGDVIIFGPDAAFVTYGDGTDDEARQEAAHFQEGDPERNQPPRPFWGFTAASTKATEDVLGARLRQVIG